MKRLILVLALALVACETAPSDASDANASARQTISRVFASSSVRSVSSAAKRNGFDAASLKPGTRIGDMTVVRNLYEGMHVDSRIEFEGETTVNARFTDFRNDAGEMDPGTICLHDFQPQMFNVPVVIDIGYRNEDVSGDPFATVDAARPGDYLETICFDYDQAMAAGFEPSTSGATMVTIDDFVLYTGFREALPPAARARVVRVDLMKKD